MAREKTILQTEPRLNDDGSPDKPHLPNSLFWDVRLEAMDWRKAFSYVIERVLERGTIEEIDELVRFYGRKKVLLTLKTKPIYLMACNIERACVYFNLRPEELKCYWRKKSRPGTGYWP